jgi:intein/homing endonuclease
LDIAHQAETQCDNVTYVSSVDKAEGISTLSPEVTKEATLPSLPTVYFDSGASGPPLYGAQKTFFCDQRGYQVQRKTLQQAYEQGHLPYTISFSAFGGFTIKKVSKLIRHEGQGKFLKITTRRGREVVVAEGSSVFTRAARQARFGQCLPAQSGYLKSIAARSLKVGMPLATIGYWVEPKRKLELIETKNLQVRITEALMELIGFYLGDGSKHGGKLRLSLGPGDEEVQKRLERFGEVFVDNDPRSKGWNVTLKDDAIYSILVELAVAGRHTSCYYKRVPEWAFGATSSQVAALLRGYHSTDGSFSGHNLEVTSVSSNLAEDVSLLLSRFGILGTLEWKYSAAGHIYHRRVIASKAAELKVFAEEIGFVNHHKQRAIERYLDSVGEVVNHKRTKHKRRYSVLYDEVEKVQEFASDDPYWYEMGVTGQSKILCSGVILRTS